MVHFGVCPVTVSPRSTSDARSQKTISPRALLLWARSYTAPAAQSPKVTLCTSYNSARDWCTKELHLMQPGFPHGNFFQVEREECGHLFRISGHYTAWLDQPLTDTWNLQINGHFTTSLPYPEHKLHRFSRKIMGTFSLSPLASCSSTWGSGHTFRKGRYTHNIRATSAMGTGTALGSAEEVLQLTTLGCPWDTLFFQTIINPQEEFYAIVVHSTDSCLYLFATIHAHQPTVNKTQQGP